jgi:hypothetical protein
VAKGGRNGPYFFNWLKSVCRTMVLPALRVLCLFVVVGRTNRNCNLSVVRSLIGLKLVGDLGLVSQISVYVLVSRFNCFLYCKQTKEQKKSPKSRF